MVSCYSASSSLASDRSWPLGPALPVRPARERHEHHSKDQDQERHNDNDNNETMTGVEDKNKAKRIHYARREERARWIIPLRRQTKAKTIVDNNTSMRSACARTQAHATLLRGAWREKGGRERDRWASYQPKARCPSLTRCHNKTSLPSRASNRSQRQCVLRVYSMPDRLLKLCYNSAEQSRL